MIKLSKVVFISDELEKDFNELKENEVELISAILEWFDHKGYERMFNY